jgi:hypothetical protein
MGSRGYSRKIDAAEHVVEHREIREIGERGRGLAP